MHLTVIISSYNTPGSYWQGTAIQRWREVAGVVPLGKMQAETLAFYRECR